MLEEKECFINRTHFKAIFKQKGFQSSIPGSRGLFQTIQGFLKFKHSVRVLGVFKAWGLPNINLFLYKPIQESTFNIHLKKLKPLEAAKAKRILMASKRATGAKVSS